MSSELRDAFLLYYLRKVILVVVVESQSLKDVAESAIDSSTSGCTVDLNLCSGNYAVYCFLQFLVVVNLCVALLLYLESWHRRNIGAWWYLYTEHLRTCGEQLGDVVVIGIDVDASEGQIFGFDLFRLLRAGRP